MQMPRDFVGGGSVLLAAFDTMARRSDDTVVLASLELLHEVLAAGRIGDRVVEASSAVAPQQ